MVQSWTLGWMRLEIGSHELCWGLKNLECLSEHSIRRSLCCRSQLGDVSIESAMVFEEYALTRDRFTGCRNVVWSSSKMIQKNIDLWIRARSPRDCKCFPGHRRSCVCELIISNPKCCKSQDRQQLIPSRHLDLEQICKKQLQRRYLSASKKSGAYASSHFEVVREIRRWRRNWACSAGWCGTARQGGSELLIKEWRDPTTCI